MDLSSLPERLDFRRVEASLLCSPPRERWECGEAGTPDLGRVLSG